MSRREYYRIGTPFETARASEQTTDRSTRMHHLTETEDTTQYQAARGLCQTESFFINKRFHQYYTAIAWRVRTRNT